MSDTISRREKAAQAAERRLQAEPTTTVTAPSTASPIETACRDSKAEGRQETCKMTHVSAGSCSRDGRGEGGASRKRPVEQVGFSDSDSDEVACVGVSAPARRTQERGSKGAAFNNAGGHRDRDRGAASNKRGRTEGAAPAAPAAAAAAAATSAVGTGTVGKRDASAPASSSSGSLPDAPKAFRVVSWNIDCLNGENKMARVEEACAIILETEPTPDVILLQEVDSDVFPILNARLGAGGRYRAYPRRVPVENRYFTIMFVKTSTVTVLDSGREEFPHSRMGRDLASIRATFNGKPFLIMTSHLESEKQSSNERKAQFNKALRQLLGFRDGPAIFAGDTNLREPEVKKEKLAKEAGDMWQLCGADPDQRFTWDMAKNDNHVFGGGFQPRARYDRMFVNPEAQSLAKAFALLGTQRMAPPHSCFPSDHFGMDARFEW
eukprot:g12203.t1